MAPTLPRRPFRIGVRTALVAFMPGSLISEGIVVRRMAVELT